MKIIKDISDLELLKDDVICYPTDTCFGLSCSINSKLAIDKIYKIKQREERKIFSVAVKDKKYIKDNFILSSKEEELIDKYLPGRLTIILRPKDINQYRNLLGFIDTIGVRVIDDKYTSSIIDKYNSPIVTTSANASGRDELYIYSDVINEFKDMQPDILIEGELKKISPSTVIKVINNKIEILRHGDLIIQEK